MREYPSAKVDEAYEKTATASGNRRILSRSVCAKGVGKEFEVWIDGFGTWHLWHSATQGTVLRFEWNRVMIIEPKKHEPKAQKGPLDVNLDEPELGTRVFAFWNK